MALALSAVNRKSIPDFQDGRPRTVAFVFRPRSSVLSQIKLTCMLLAQKGQAMATTKPLIHIGCAGWSIPRQYAEYFPERGTHLERYAQRLPAVEINSSFYRPHRPATYTRWAASVPESFRFAVKLPQEITHRRRLHDVTEPLDRFLSEITALGVKLGLILIQLPPSLRFDSAIAQAFFTALRARFGGSVVCEPRHASWFTGTAERVLVAARVARVAADPAPVPEAAQPGGWPGLVYYRLHGSPEMYVSTYTNAYLDKLTRTLGAAAVAAPTWCIFDNTTLGAATLNALDLCARFSATDHGDLPAAGTVGQNKASVLRISRR
jgi:uncharacterized protein YecE (DUF72 family)